MASGGQGEGLHILLVVAIVFVVAFGVAAGLMYQNMATAHQDLERTKKDLETAKKVEKDLLGYLEQFKQLHDVANLEHKAALERARLDAEKYGPDAEKNIPAAIRRLARAESDLKDQLAEEKKAREAAEALLKQVRGELDKGIAEHRTAREEAEKKLAELDQKYREFREEFEKVNQKLRQEREKALIDLRQAKRDYEEMAADFAHKRNFMQQTIDALQEKVEKIKVANLQYPDGRVIRSDASHGYVYIDLGSAHKVKPGFTFSIYGYNQVGSPYHEPKAKIEIKKVQGPEMSMAVLLEHDPADPVVAGDLVYSPTYDRFWQERFAIAGRFDVDGDGHDDRELLVQLIREQGGIVVAELLPDGTFKGEINVNTNWLLLGEAPSDEEISQATEEKRNAIKKMLDETEKLRKHAKDLGVSVINMRNFLNYMGYISPQRLTMAPVSR